MKPPPAPPSGLSPPQGSLASRRPGLADAPRVILDTQVVLDWLLFADESTVRLAQAVRGSRLTWLATPAMRAELEDVLGRPALARWRPDPPRLLAAMDTLATIQDPVIAALAAAPQCRDPDDQIFVDAALAFGARFLFSRDKAVLALSGPLQQRGVRVLRPEDWPGPGPSGG